MRKLLEYVGLMKPKSVIKMTDLHKKVGNVAKKYGEGFYTSSVDFETRTSRPEEIEVVLTGYINNFPHVKGKTIEEVCEKLEAFKCQNPEVSPIKEVEL